MEKKLNKKICYEKTDNKNLVQKLRVQLLKILRPTKNTQKNRRVFAETKLSIVKCGRDNFRGSLLMEKRNRKHNCDIN